MSNGVPWRFCYFKAQHPVLSASPGKVMTRPATATIAAYKGASGRLPTHISDALMV
jgi:hypothetical protein